MRMSLLEPGARRTGKGAARQTRAPSIAALPQALGNRALAGLLHTRLAVGAPGDRWEQEADRVADEAMRGPGAAPAGGGAGARLQRMPAGGAAAAPGLSPAAHERVRAATAGGQPLPAETRGFFEPRLGRDLGGVRVHTGGAAAEAARALDAKAFTLGRDVVFGGGEYAPHTAPGRRLIAHELAHTVQQGALDSGAARVVQRQPAPGGTTQPASKPAALTAQDIFPFARGARVVLGRMMGDDWFDRISSFSPETADALTAIWGKEARVTAATDDLFEAVIEGQVSLPARGGNPARTLKDVTLRLARSGDTFNFTITATEGDPPAPTTLMEQPGLSATRDGKAVVLFTGDPAAPERRLRVAPGARGEAELSVFTAPFLEQVPEKLRGVARALAPERLDVLRIRKLDDAATSADVQREAESMASGLGRRRQQISLGAGGSLAGGRLAPVFTAAWQIHFPFPQDAAGQFVHIPLELRVQYAPPEGVLGSVTSGGTVKIPSKVPVNLTLVGGLGGGQVQVPGATPGTLDRKGAFGPILGGSAEVELGRWRVHLRYEHLWNLVSDAPGVDSLGLGGGIAF